MEPNEVAIPPSLFAVDVITNAFRHAYSDLAQGTIAHVCQLMRGSAYQLGGKLETIGLVGAGTQLRLEYQVNGQIRGAGDRHLVTTPSPKELLSQSEACRQPEW